MGLFSSESKDLMAIDISSTGIKLIELSHSRAGYALKSFAIVPLPRDAIVENMIIDSMAVSQGLIDALEQAKPSTRQVALAVSGNAVIIKNISLPTMTEFMLEAEIDVEADQHVPYDIDEVYLDFQILGEQEDEPGQMDVVLAACKREIVDDYQLVLSEAGLTTKCVDCSVFALENASEMMGAIPTASKDVADGESDQAVGLINIGANLINVNIIKNGKMAFVRDQFYGGQNLTEEIQKEHNISYQAAETMKKERFHEVSPEAIDRFYVGLTSEIVRSLDFYAANHGDHPVQHLSISGGCALIPDIAVEIEQRLGISASVVNPFDHIKVNKRKFDVEYLMQIGSMMVVPIGLALRGFD
jgi:type IV pilus assembly protein PilM